MITFSCSGRLSAQEDYWIVSSHLIPIAGKLGERVFPGLQAGVFALGAVPSVLSCFT